MKKSTGALQQMTGTQGKAWDADVIRNGEGH